MASDSTPSNSSRKQSYAKASVRKLAAIFFADIVGYTALMQKDEKQARTTLDKFRETLNQKATDHNGLIVNDLGDGCLCTFDSAVDAVKCAKEAQETFLQEPKIPVRIGLHSGDVFYEADNVYGDSVNIASRIESLGVAGSVLFSKRIRQHIENQSEFEIKSLGAFDFKNVNKTMEVYTLANQGLVVPKRAEMKGKVKNNSSVSKYLIGVVVLLLIIGIYAAYQLLSKNNTPKISSEMRKERIAVIPFENNTGDAELDNLGVVAADWINQGFMDMQEAEVVSNFTIRTHKASIGIMENDPQGRASFAQLTGAQNLITGSFYKEGDQLRTKLEIVDALQGKLRFAFEPIDGKESDKEELINQLREKVTGYWAARDVVDSRAIKAPKYEAYQLFLSGLKENVDANSLSEILAIDSTFYLPRLYFLGWNLGGVYGSNQEHFDFLERHSSDLSHYEQALLTFYRYAYLGKKQLAFKTLNKLRLKYPKHFVLNRMTGSFALRDLNNPELLLDIYNQFPIEDVPHQHLGIGYHFWIARTVVSLARLNKIEEIDAFLSEVEPDFEAHTQQYFRALIIQALVIKDDEKLESAYAKLKTSRMQNPFMYLFIMGRLTISNLVSESFRIRIRTDILTFIDELPENDPSRLSWRNYSAAVNADTSKINLDLPSRASIIDIEMPNNRQIFNLILAGRTHFKTGQYDMVESIIERLKKYDVGPSLRICKKCLITGRFSTLFWLVERISKLANMIW